MPGASWKLVLESLLREVDNELIRLRQIAYTEERDLRITLAEAKKNSLNSALEVLAQALEEERVFYPDEIALFKRVEASCSLRNNEIRNIFRIT